MLQKRMVQLMLFVFLGQGVPLSATPPFYNRWQTFDVSDGLPSNKVFCVYATDSEVWAGTDNGLVRWDGKEWRTYNTRDGLAHRVVMAIAQDPNTGDLWFATLGGVSRFSGGRFDTFTQLNSGLTNDVVYGLTVANGEVWAATAAGASRYEIGRNRWTLYDETNTPMHEIWCYSAASCGDKVYLAVWGGGLLEFSRSKKRWKDYRDPDGEMEIDLFRNDGLVHDVVSSVACDDSGVVWVGTYFGLSTYDGRKWLNFMDHDPPVGGLVSNFINFVTTHDGMGWIATDNGLNATDRKHWWTYQRDPETGRGIVLWAPADAPQERIEIETIFPHNYIFGISFQGDDIWLATGEGLARGWRAEQQVESSSLPDSPRKRVLGRPTRAQELNDLLGKGFDDGVQSDD
ncbi:MAG: regulator [Planctomycetes bacterium]|nr:regulator [Planctomycetota bacterium]